MPVGGGPSPNTCPRCASQRTQVTSMRGGAALRSGANTTCSSSTGCQKLGQPVCESNFVCESNSSRPQHTHKYRPALIAPILVGKRRFGFFAARDGELLFRQQLSPLGVALMDALDLWLAAGSAISTATIGTATIGTAGRKRARGDTTRSASLAGHADHDQARDNHAGQAANPHATSSRWSLAASHPCRQAMILSMTCPNTSVSLSSRPW